MINEMQTPVMPVRIRVRPQADAVALPLPADLRGSLSYLHGHDVHDGKALENGRPRRIGRVTRSGRKVIAWIYTDDKLVRVGEVQTGHEALDLIIARTKGRAS